MPRHVLGWKEFVRFVDWPLRRVKAKIDTGARTSAPRCAQLPAA